MEGMMMLEEHSPMGTVTLGTISLGRTMVMAMTSIYVVVMGPVTLVGPIVGINGYEVQRGQELGELQATVMVSVCSGKELADVVIDGRVRLQQDKHEKVSLKHSGVQGQPTATA